MFKHLKLQFKIFNNYVIINTIKTNKWLIMNTVNNNSSTSTLPIDLEQNNVHIVRSMQHPGARLPRVQSRPPQIIYKTIVKTDKRGMITHFEKNGTFVPYIENYDLIIDSNWKLSGEAKTYLENMELLDTMFTQLFPEEKKQRLPRIIFPSDPIRTDGQGQITFFEKNGRWIEYIPAYDLRITEPQKVPEQIMAVFAEIDSAREIGGDVRIIDSATNLFTELFNEIDFTQPEEPKGLEVRDISTWLPSAFDKIDELNLKGWKFAAFLVIAAVFGTLGFIGGAIVGATFGCIGGFVTGGPVGALVVGGSTALLFGIFAGSVLTLLASSYLLRDPDHTPLEE